MILNRGRKLSNAEMGEVTFQKSSSHPVAVVEREAGEAEGERRGGGAGCRCNGGATFPRCLSRPPPAWSPAAMEGKEQGRERERHGCYKSAGAPAFQNDFRNGGFSGSNYPCP